MHLAICFDSIILNAIIIATVLRHFYSNAKIIIKKLFSNDSVNANFCSERSYRGNKEHKLKSRSMNFYQISSMCTNSYFLVLKIGKFYK